MLVGLVWFGKLGDVELILCFNFQFPNLMQILIHPIFHDDFKEIGLGYQTEWTKWLLPVGVVHRSPSPFCWPTYFV